MYINNYILCILFMINVAGFIAAIFGVFGILTSDNIPWWYWLAGIPICGVGSYVAAKGLFAKATELIPKYTAKNKWGEQ